MPAQPFDPEAKTLAELVASRTPRFVDLEVRAAKGQYARPPLTREERELVKEYLNLTRQVGRVQVG